MDKLNQNELDDLYQNISYLRHAFGCIKFHDPRLDEAAKLVDAVWRDVINETVNRISK